MQSSFARGMAISLFIAVSSIGGSLTAATLTTQSFSFSLSDDEDVPLSINNSGSTPASASKIALKSASTSSTVQGFDSGTGTLDRVILSMTALTGNVEANEIGDTCNAPGLGTCEVDTSGTVNFTFGLDLSILPDGQVGAPGNANLDLQVRQSRLDIQGGNPVPLVLSGTQTKSYSAADELALFIDSGPFNVIARGYMDYAIQLNCSWFLVLDTNKDCSGGLQGVYSGVRISGTLTYEYTEPVVVDPSPVPLPAGLPLLLVGIGGLTLLRRRR